MQCNATSYLGQFDCELHDGYQYRFKYQSFFACFTRNVVDLFPSSWIKDKACRSVVCMVGSPGTIKFHPLLGIRLGNCGMYLLDRRLSLQVWSQWPTYQFLPANCSLLAARNQFPGYDHSMNQFPVFWFQSIHSKSGRLSSLWPALPQIDSDLNWDRHVAWRPRTWCPSQVWLSSLFSGHYRFPFWSPIPLHHTVDWKIGSFKTCSWRGSALVSSGL